MQKKKIKYFYLTIILLLSFMIESAIAKKVQGYFVLTNNDTVSTFFNIHSLNDYPQLYSAGVIYLDSNNNEQFLTPDMAEEVCFILNNHKVKLVSKECQGSFTKAKYSFLRVISEEGYLKMYFFSQHKSCSEVLKKGNDTLFFTNGLHRQNKLMQYFSDCPGLAQKIKEGKIESTLEMVKEYNKSCAKK